MNSKLSRTDLHHMTTDCCGNMVSYESHGELIYFETPDGYVEKYKYSSDGKQLVEYENSNGMKEWWDCDITGNVIYHNNLDKLC